MHGMNRLIMKWYVDKFSVSRKNLGNRVYKIEGRHQQPNLIESLENNIPN